MNQKHLTLLIKNLYIVLRVLFASSIFTINTCRNSNVNLSTFLTSFSTSVHKTCIASNLATFCINHSFHSVVKCCQYGSASLRSSFFKAGVFDHFSFPDSKSINRIRGSFFTVSSFLLLFVFLLLIALFLL